MSDPVLPITSPEWHAALFDDFPLPLAVVDHRHRFVSCNHAYCRLLGYARSELLGTRWQEYTHPGDIAGDEAGANALSHHGSTSAYSVDKRYVCKDGADAWVTLHVRSVFHDAEFAAYYVLAIPHTESHQATNNGQSRLWKWAKANPKDALLIGGAVGYFLGIDRVLEILQTVLKP